ncbi:hypothetical protein SNEBB_009175 [Seison nebaliae]|nr:hypothetical protein SNEBB_009175 [Seison nebaliae]
MKDLAFSIDFNSSVIKDTIESDNEEEKKKSYTEKSSVEETIERLKKKRKLKTKLISNNSDEEDEDDVNMENDEDDENDEVKDDIIKEKKIRKKTTNNEEINKFFENVSINSNVENVSFNRLNLCRPLMKALTEEKWIKPTGIQLNSIPLILQGKDICACAITGSGKTGAFILPIIERLFHYTHNRMTSNRNSIKVLIMTPTRELALQINEVTRKLLKFIPQITVTTVIGGTDAKDEELILRNGIDILIGTPGRLIDHLYNTPGFSLHSIEILVLDEADRMLDDMFTEQIHEIVKMCDKERQTLLFSATMTEEIETLMNLSLKSPAKVFMNENTEITPYLNQEFIRIRNDNNLTRQSILLSLLQRSFEKNVIVFVQTKVLCHHLHVLLSLIDMNVGELHGNLTQQQRIEVMKKFKKKEIDILIATDLASRGIDIPDVNTIINYTMPASLKHYIHRVGRTARAGKQGTSVSLVGESERKLLKEIIPNLMRTPKARIIPSDILDSYRKQLVELEADIKEVHEAEQCEKEMRTAEHKLHKAQKLLEDNKDEITSQKEERQWYKDRQEKKNTNEQSLLEPKAKGRKIKKKKRTDILTRDVNKAILLNTKQIKKSQKDQPLNTFIDDNKNGVKDGRINKNKNQSRFTRELVATGKKSLKSMRYAGKKRRR